jgi:protein-tyrosine-phosphatase
MQKVQVLLQPTEMETHPLAVESRRVGRVEGKTSSASRISTWASALCRARSSSAGSEPIGDVHPLTLHYLTAAGISTKHLRSKSWDELAGFPPDAIITICDHTVDERCPLWLGLARKIQWHLADPSAETSDQEFTVKNFQHAIAMLEQRIGAFADCLRRGALYCDSLLVLDQLSDTYPEAGPPLISLTPPRVLHVSHSSLCHANCHANCHVNRHADYRATLHANHARGSEAAWTDSTT